LEPNTVQVMPAARGYGRPLIACGDRIERLLKMTGLDRHLTVVRLPSS
jgi:hypothetical protein